MMVEIIFIELDFSWGFQEYADADADAAAELSNSALLFFPFPLIRRSSFFLFSQALASIVQYLLGPKTDIIVTITLIYIEFLYQNEN